MGACCSTKNPSVKQTPESIGEEVHGNNVLDDSASEIGFIHEASHQDEVQCTNWTPEIHHVPEATPDTSDPSPGMDSNPGPVKNLYEKQLRTLPAPLRATAHLSEIMLESSFLAKFVTLPWHGPTNPKDPEVHKSGQANSLKNLDGWNPGRTEWTDPLGLPRLTEKQKKRLCRWDRVRNMKKPITLWTTKPRISTVRQGFVGDCSLLSSVGVLAEYDFKYGSDTLRSIIHPLINGEGDIFEINSHGMYACRFFFNGTSRTVVVDDILPVRSNGEVLCGYSSVSGEMWLSILEKAHVKIMGHSYTMQGSNPSTDIYHLTGWISETIPLRTEGRGLTSDNQPKRTPGGLPCRRTAQLEYVWDIISNGLANGWCVVCAGTSEIYDATYDGTSVEGISRSSGIVSHHCYSVLSFVVIGRQRLLYMKNPWDKAPWRGEWGPQDTLRWTPDVQKMIQYDRAYEERHYPGYFWIPWSDVLKWFSHLYISWTPTRFKEHKILHCTWTEDPGRKLFASRDDYLNAMYTPQFSLTVEKTVAPADVWILVTRHVRNRAEDLSTKYISVSVEEGDKYVLAPAKGIKSGGFFNGECYLLKMKTTDFPRNQSDGKYNHLLVVLSQYSRIVTLQFSISVYSDAPVLFKQLAPPMDHTWTPLVIDGAWTKGLAGGSSNDLWSYLRNPHYRLRVLEDTKVIIFLESLDAHDASVNIRLFKATVITPRTFKDSQISSGSYRTNVAAIESNVEVGQCSLIPSNYYRGEEGRYRLSVFVPKSSSVVLEPMVYPHMPLDGCMGGLWTKKIKCGLHKKITIRSDVATEMSIRIENVSHISTYLPTISVYVGNSRHAVGDLEGGVTGMCSVAAVALYRDLRMAVLSGVHVPKECTISFGLCSADVSTRSVQRVDASSIDVVFDVIIMTRNQFECSV